MFLILSYFSITNRKKSHLVGKLKKIKIQRDLF
jgi:hypothetical protein